MSRRFLSAREQIELLMAWRRTATDDVREPGDDLIKPSPGPHRLSIERHLLDEDYRDDWVGSDESYESDPEMVHENHGSGAQAVNRMRDVAADWGCTVSEYPGDSRLDGGEPGTRYFKFDGPEEGEVQGYAELRPRPVPKQDYRPGDDAYPALNRSLLSRRTAAPDRGKPLQWVRPPHYDREAYRAEPGDHYSYHVDSPRKGGFDVWNPHVPWPDMWSLSHGGPVGEGEDQSWYDSPHVYFPSKEEAMEAAAAHHVLGVDPLEHPSARRKEDYRLTPEQERAVAENRKKYHIGEPDPDFEWDDGDEDDAAPPGVFVPPKYHPNPDADFGEAGYYGPTGEMYGTHRERYLEDLFHGHLVDLTDQEAIDSYEHQRKQPGFRGSDLEDTMWTNISNRYEESGDHDDFHEEGDEDLGHPKIVDYFNKVHGCDEHLWTPPDMHEPHGNFGEHPEGWDPDDDQDPFDPRLIGAARTITAARGLNWEQSDYDLPDTQYNAWGKNDDHYNVLAPGHHADFAVNGFGERVDSEHPEMWALIHRFEPQIGWEHQVTYHPTREDAMGAAEHHHATGEAPVKHPGAVPHSDYDEDRVEMWPEIAEQYEDEWEEENLIPDELRLPPEYPGYADRKNGLDWSYEDRYRDDPPSYEAGGAGRAHYSITGPHHDEPHPDGPYSLRWYDPHVADAIPPGELSYQSPHAGISRHRSIEDAMSFAENHNDGRPTPRPRTRQEMLRDLGFDSGHVDSDDLDEMWQKGQGWNPDDDPDPDDPRIRGAGKQ